MKLSIAGRPRPTTWVAATLAVTAVLAACAVIVRRQRVRVEHEFPPKGRFVDVDGVRLHVLEWGRADAEHTVVLLHGNGTMAEEWDISGLADALAGRYRVIAFDRPGFGWTERPTDRAWTQQAQADLFDGALSMLGVQRPVVVGHSWAAGIALAMGAQHPERVGALVLVSGYYTPSLRLDVGLLGLPALPLVGTLMRHTLTPLLGRLLWPLALRRVFSPAEVTKAFRERYPVWMSLRPSQLRASAAESARLIPSAFRQRPLQQALRVPTVVVAGAQDHLLSTRWHSRKLAERLPQVRLHVVEHAGHMVHHTAPEAIRDAIDLAAALARQPLPAADGPQTAAAPPAMTPGAGAVAAAGE
jgi:pimeloyl-ACP methyl ester carboxylesterase